MFSFSRNARAARSWRTAQPSPDHGAAGEPPFGFDVYRDIERWLPAFEPNVVFDVGANVGQSAQSYLTHWPDAEIHCFEPAPSTYLELTAALAHIPNVKTHRLAFSEREGQGRMTEAEHSTRSTLAMEAQSPEDSPSEAVPVTTIDLFCERNSIARINFLKVDTEGADLDVLRGAELMLRAGAIDLVQAEAGMYPGNERHVPFEQIKSFLEERGYVLFGMYDQFLERLYRKPHLRRTNPVFVARSFADECGDVADWKLNDRSKNVKVSRKLYGLVRNRLPQSWSDLIELGYSGDKYLASTGWIRSRQSGKAVDAEGNPLPCYTYPAIEFLKARIPADAFVFEFGAGNSTLWWSRHAAKVAFCESDRGRFDRIASKLPGNVTGTVHPQTSEDYVGAASAPGEAIRILAIEGRNRVECCKRSLDSLADDGVVVWDDSEREQDGEGHDLLRSRGFRRIDFWGLGPLSMRAACTSVFYRTDNCFGI